MNKRYASLTCCSYSEPKAIWKVPRSFWGLLPLGILGSNYEMMCIIMCIIIVSSLFLICLCFSRATAGNEGLSIQRGGGGGRLRDSHHVLRVFSHLRRPDVRQEEEETILIVVVYVTQSAVSLFILPSRARPPSACALLILLVLLLFLQSSQS